MIRAFTLLLILIGPLTLAGQDLQPVKTTTAPAACQVTQAKEYLDKYFACGANPAHADILQISYGEAGPKLHIFTSKAAWEQHFHAVEHKNCSDFQVASGSKPDRQIQRGYRRNRR